MPDLVWFEWEKCPDGYSIEVMKPEYLRSAKGKFSTIFQPTDSAPPWVHKMLRAYGPDPSYWYHLDLYDEEEYLIPRSEASLKFKPLEGNDAAFMELADCYDSVPNVRNFVTKYGFLEDIYMPGPTAFPIKPMASFQEGAEEIRNAIKLWEEAKAKNNFDHFLSWIETEDETGSPLHPDHVANVPMNVRLRHRADHSGAPFLSIIPQNLEVALWLQFFQTVSADRQLRRCAVCPTWFSYGTGTGRRKSAHYCSDRCRKAAHRNRKEAAR